MEKIIIMVDEQTKEIYISFSKKLKKFIKKNKISFNNTFFAMYLISITYPKVSFSQGDLEFTIQGSKKELKNYIEIASNYEEASNSSFWVLVK